MNPINESLLENKKKYYDLLAQKILYETQNKSQVQKKYVYLDKTLVITKSRGYL